jgi:hypothetical protein
MVRAMHGIRTILLLLAPGIALGANQSVSLPDWLTPVQGATSVIRIDSDGSVDLTFVAPSSPADAIKRYQQQMDKAGATYRISFDGIGSSIAASTGSLSCIIQIAEAERGARVRVGCVPETAQPNARGAAPAMQQSAAAPPSAKAGVVKSAAEVKSSEVKSAEVKSTEAKSAAVRPAEVPPSSETPRGVIRPVVVPIQGSADIAGWSQARWGMTQAQILNAFPGEAKILTDNPSTRQYGSRGLATVGISHADIRGVPVRMLFLFDRSGELDGIRMPATPASASGKEHDAMEKALTRVYGAPSLRAAQSSAEGAAQKGLVAVWLMPTSVIQLNYFPGEWLSVSIDKRAEQTPKSIMASWPGYHWSK